MKRWLIVLILIPLFVFAISESSWGVYRDTDYGVTYAVHRAKCVNKEADYYYPLYDLYEMFSGMLREYTYCKYNYIVLIVVNKGRYPILWDDDEAKVVLQINDDGNRYKIESKNYAKRYLNDYMITQMQEMWLSNANLLDRSYWDMRFGSKVFMKGEIDSRTRGVTQKMIGFDKNFSWYDIERGWIKIDGITYEMNIQDSFK